MFIYNIPEHSRLMPDGPLRSYCSSMLRHHCSCSDWVAAAGTSAEYKIYSFISLTWFCVCVTVYVTVCVTVCICVCNCVCVSLCVCNCMCNCVCANLFVCLSVDLISEIVLSEWHHDLVRPTFLKLHAHQSLICLMMFCSHPFSYVFPLVTECVDC